MSLLNIKKDIKWDVPKMCLNRYRTEESIAKT